MVNIPLDSPGKLGGNVDNGNVILRPADETPRVKSSQQTQGFPIHGQLSPSASSTSFVFPVRSVYANFGQAERKASRSSDAGGQMSPRLDFGGYTPDPSPNSHSEGVFRDRSPSLPNTGGSIASILAQGNSIQNMLEGHTFDLSAIHRSLPSHMQNGQAGPSSSHGTGSLTDRNLCYSAPLPSVAESDRTSYFIDALLSEARRKSDGEQGDAVEMSQEVYTPNQRLPSPAEHNAHSQNNTSSEEANRSANSTHAHGQIDPAPRDEPSPGQTTFGNDQHGNSARKQSYNFRHHPGDVNTPINLSGPSEGKKIRAPRVESQESAQSHQSSCGGFLQAAGDAQVRRPEPVNFDDRFQPNGLAESGRRPHKYDSSDSEDAARKTIVSHNVHKRHNDNEPDVGPGRENRDGDGRVEIPSDSDAHSLDSSNYLQQYHRPMDTGITILAQVQESHSSLYGTATSGSLGGSKNALTTAMGKGPNKSNAAYADSIPADYQSNVQRFVDGQANTTNMSDPNAPTPSPGPDNADLEAKSSESDEYDMPMESDSGPDRNTRASGTSAGSVDEPVMTVRFEHTETADGHHVVTGREGQLEKCEDEPITTPGAVQSFGVLLVVEEDLESGILTVCQVSENSTELLGLSPRYLFQLPCFSRVLSRHQDHILRDNIDYLPDPEMTDSTLTDEGPHVFLLSGYGEPGTSEDYRDDEHARSTISEDRRREWTCWVAAHRPSQSTKAMNGEDTEDETKISRNLIVMEFELEKDTINPLYPAPPDTSEVLSPTAQEGNSDAASLVSDSTQVAKTGPRTNRSNSSTARPSAVTSSSGGSRYSASTVPTLKDINLKLAQPKLRGLEGEEMQINPEHILESTTSHSKPLRALERLRRMTRTRALNNTEETGRGRNRKARAGTGTGSGRVGTMDVFAVLAQINDQLSQAADLESFLKIVVGVIKDLTQFHRCLVYSFDGQWNGQVVAELVDWSKTHDLYKGLQFPATDIPAQARELYRINKVRMLYDRAQTTARMVLRSRRDLETPLDMTHCYLRAMSPIHMVYLRNMGVRSSMSISIMAFGSLWGLIACHGYGDAGLRVSFPVRQMLRLLSDSVSRNIERLSYAARLKTRKLISTIPTEAHPTGYIVSNANDLLNLFDADFGVMVIGEGAKILGSSTEHGQEILLIAEYLRYKKYEQMQISSHIGEDFPELCTSRALEIISGLLYVPLSTGGQDFIAFLRKGQLREVHWAGKPYKEGKEKGANLEPRASFKVWSETITGRSRNWSDEQLETAGVLALVYGKFIEVWRQKESALRANQMTSLLLNNATHEVRTPLNHIINYLELALDGQLDNDTRENLSRSHTASKSLLFTINDLLDLTRIESGNATSFNDPFDIRDCIEKAAQIYAAEAKRKDLEFVVDVESAPPGLLLGDQKKIRTVVANLVANAVKYTEKGKISVVCREREGTSSSEAGTGSTSLLARMEIIVGDTGCGISTERLQAMFVTLEQADSNQSQSNNGLGLGLAVVARIVEQVGGTLRADSEVGVGTRFYFSLTMANHETSVVGQSEIAKSMRSRSNSTDSLISSRQNSGGTRELDTFVSAFSQSHMGRQTSANDAIAAAEARMSAEGAFPVADSSWPIRPAKMEEGKTQPPTRPARLSRTQSHAHNPKSSVLKIATGRSTSSLPSPPASPTTTGTYTDELPETVPTGEKPKKKKVKSSGQKYRVLIVEDDDVNRKILERRLKLDGHDVSSDINGQEAVDRFKRDQTFDCILMDIQMPIMDGRQAAAAIRQFEKSLTQEARRAARRVHDRIPIIAVSATLVESERTKLAVDFDGWIMKPIDFKRMLTVLAGVSAEENRLAHTYVHGAWEKGGWLKKALNGP